MEQDTTVDYPVIDVINRRWSPRSFSDRAVSDEALGSLFEAARWAPSSYNEQPWHFIVGRKDSETYSKILDSLIDFNRKWAKGAPVLVVSAARNYFSRNDKPNRHYMHDTGMAVAQLTIQATSLDLRVHQMAGFDADQLETDFNFPDNYEAVAVFAIGYEGSPSELADENLVKSEKAEQQRKPQEEFVHFEGFSS